MRAWSSSPNALIGRKRGSEVVCHHVIEECQKVQKPKSQNYTHSLYPFRRKKLTSFRERERERERGGGGKRERAKHAHTHTHTKGQICTHQNDPNVRRPSNGIYAHYKSVRRSSPSIVTTKSTSSFTYTDVGLADENIKSNLQRRKRVCVCVCVSNRMRGKIRDHF